MTTISIHRALSLVKKAEAIASDKIHNGTFVGITTGSANVVKDRSYRNVQELRSGIQADTDTVESNINLIVKLKKAIAAKNLETMVDFKGNQVSVTELLAIRTTLILREQYVKNLNSQIARANLKAEEAERAINEQLSNADPSQKEATHAQLTSSMGVNIITASGQSAAEKLRQLREENQFLVDEVDLLLSETNLSTMIEVDM